MFTRTEYLNHSASHADYYGQFVTDHEIEVVRKYIGASRIRNSKDPHLNDIPLALWDSLQSSISMEARRRLQQADPGGMSLSDAVCILKAAARRI